MSVIEAIILGVVQGLTEFIPVSSSGHLVILHKIFGSDSTNLSFDVALHFGTLMALLIYFRKDVINLAKALFIKSSQTKLAWILAFATIPAAITGFTLENLLESRLRSSNVVAITLIIGAILMLLAEKWAKHDKRPKTKLNNTSLKQGLGIGVAQTFALLPGFSRSGSTITAGVFAGLDRSSATRFAFLLGIPIMVGAVLKVFLSSEGLGNISSQTNIFFIGALTAFISGLFAIKFMLKFLSKNSLNSFAYYRIALGVIVFAYTLLN